MPDRERAQNLYYLFKMSEVRADMSDEDIERLSDGFGRMKTSLLGKRARLRNPVLDAYCRAFDRWHQLMETDASVEEIDRAYAAVEQAMDRLNARDDSLR